MTQHPLCCYAASADFTQASKAMLRVGVLQSVHVGTPHRYGTAGARDVLERPWTMSFVRVPNTEPRWLYTTHLDGNAQAGSLHSGSRRHAHHARRC
jgi:hypothetical protein